MNLKNKLRLDLTRKRIKLNGRTSDILRDNTMERYAFADVHCKLCLKLGDEFHYYQDEEEFSDLIKDWMEGSAKSQQVIFRISVFITFVFLFPILFVVVVFCKLGCSP